MIKFLANSIVGAAAGLLVHLAGGPTWGVVAISIVIYMMCTLTDTILKAIEENH